MGAIGVTLSRQVDRDHVEALGKARHRLVPSPPGLRESGEQHEGGRSTGRLPRREAGLLPRRPQRWAKPTRSRSGSPGTWFWSVEGSGPMAASVKPRAHGLWSSAWASAARGRQAGALASRQVPSDRVRPRADRGMSGHSNSKTPGAPTGLHSRHVRTERRDAQGVGRPRRRHLGRVG